MNNDIHIRNWMANCPYVESSTVSQNGKLEYGIYPSSDELRYHENVLGEKIPNEEQEMDFIFTAKRYYTGADADDYTFFSDIVKWINQQNAKGNFPTINEGNVKSVVPSINQYVSEPNRKEERCQIQIQVIYKLYHSYQ